MEKLLSNRIIWQIKESNICNSTDSYSSNKKKILFVLLSGSGGTPKTVNDIAKNIFNQYECYLLTCDTNIMKLFK